MSKNVVSISDSLIRNHLSESAILLPHGQAIMSGLSSI